VTSRWSVVTLRSLRYGATRRRPMCEVKRWRSVALFE